MSLKREVRKRPHMFHLRSRVKRAIKAYNSYRVPEAKAKLLKFKGEFIIVKFSGSFCETCGINDWIEDLKYVLEDFKVEAKMVEVIEPNILDENYRIGVFKVENVKVARMHGSNKNLNYTPSS